MTERDVTSPAPTTNATATLQFRPDWTTTTTSEIVQGGQLCIEYDPERLMRCRMEWDGAEIWGLEVQIIFHPRGTFSASLLKDVRPEPWGPVIAHAPQPVDVTIPSDAEWIEMWFHNFLPEQVGGNQCDAWDSRYGQNYWYQVEPRGLLRHIGSQAPSRC